MTPFQEICSTNNWENRYLDMPFILAAIENEKKRSLSTDFLDVFKGDRMIARMVPMMPDHHLNNVNAPHHDLPYLFDFQKSSLAFKIFNPRLNDTGRYMFTVSKDTKIKLSFNFTLVILKNIQVTLYKISKKAARTLTTAFNSSALVALESTDNLSIQINIINYPVKVRPLIRIIVEHTVNIVNRYADVIHAFDKTDLPGTGNNVTWSYIFRDRIFSKCILLNGNLLIMNEIASIKNVTNFRIEFDRNFQKGCSAYKEIEQSPVNNRSRRSTLRCVHFILNTSKVNFRINYRIISKSFIENIAWFNKSGSTSYMNNEAYALEHGEFWSDLVMFDLYASDDKRYMCEVILENHEIYKKDIIIIKDIEGHNPLYVTLPIQRFKYSNIIPRDHVIDISNRYIGESISRSFLKNKVTVNMQNAIYKKYNKIHYIIFNIMSKLEVTFNDASSWNVNSKPNDPEITLKVFKNGFLTFKSALNRLYSDTLQCEECQSSMGTVFSIYSRKRMLIIHFSDFTAIGVYNISMYVDGVFEYGFEFHAISYINFVSYFYTNTKTLSFESVQARQSKQFAYIIHGITRMRYLPASLRPDVKMLMKPHNYDGYADISFAFDLTKHSHIGQEYNWTMMFRSSLLHTCLLRNATYLIRTSLLGMTRYTEKDIDFGSRHLGNNNNKYDDRGPTTKECERHTIYKDPNSFSEKNLESASILRCIHYVQQPTAEEVVVTIIQTNGDDIRTLVRINLADDDGVVQWANVSFTVTRGLYWVDVQYYWTEVQFFSAGEPLHSDGNRTSLDGSPDRGGLYNESGFSCQVHVKRELLFTKDIKLYKSRLVDNVNSFPLVIMEKQSFNKMFSENFVSTNLDLDDSTSFDVDFNEEKSPNNYDISNMFDFNGLIEYKILVISPILFIIIVIAEHFTTVSFDKKRVEKSNNVKRETWYKLIDKCIERKHIVENDIQLLTKHINFLKMINQEINLIKEETKLDSSRVNEIGADNSRILD